MSQRLNFYSQLFTMGQIFVCECCEEQSRCIIDQNEVEIVRPTHCVTEYQRKMGYIPVVTCSPMSSRNQTPRSIISSYFYSPRGNEP